MAVHKVGILLLINYFVAVHGSYHWKVTESGRISSQVENSGFPLTKQDDLFAILEQEQRLKVVNKLFKELMALKISIDTQWANIEREGDVEKRLYSSDVDCLLGQIPLGQLNLNTEFVDYGQGSRPKMKDNVEVVEPDCTQYSKLDFSMRVFPHLETLKGKSELNMSLNPVPSNIEFNFNIDEMLRSNNSDWAAYNVASLYWRTLGNGTNALECAKRALYFSPREQRHIVLLNLGTLLQELESLGEAAIVLHSAVDHDPVQEISHLALGNVYTALGDYNRSLACYENVLSLNPGHTRALQLKHALLCHKKLEIGLVSIHVSLQNILKDLQTHNAMHEEWLRLQNLVEWERNSKVKEFFSLSQPIYLNLQMLLQNVEHQAKTLNEEVSKRVPKKVNNEKNGRKDRRKKKTECTEEKRKEESAEVSSKNSIEEEEKGAESFMSSSYLLTNKINSLISFLKSSYEEEIKLMDFKRNFPSGKSQFSFDEPLLLGNMGACVKDSTEVKKLN